MVNKRTPILFLLFLLTFSIWVSANQGVPEMLPIQARITDTNGNPIDTARLIEFRIYPPTGTCWLYSETHSITPTTYGLFSHMLGTGTRNGPNTSLFETFKNVATAPINDSCGVPYIPGAYDWRRLQIIVAGVPMPDMQTLASSPYAMNSQMIDGLTSAQLIQVQGAVTQATLGTLVSGGDASALHHHDSLYVKADGSTPITGNVSTSADIIASSATSQIGVGTSTPAADLDIRKGSPSIRLEATAAGGGTSAIEFFSGVTRRGGILAQENADGLRLLSGNNTALEIDAFGNAIFNYSMSTSGVFGLGKYTNAQEPALLTALTTLGTTAKGNMWVNSTDNLVKYWDGTTAVTFSNTHSSVQTLTTGNGLSNSGTATAPVLNVSYGTAANTAIQGNANFGGDIAGNYSNLQVNALRGYPIDFTLTPTTGNLLLFNGTHWIAQTPSLSGLQNLNGLGTSTQIFAIGTTGVSPAIVSSGTTHTFNFPLASNAGVTAGLISKTEYDAFNAKVNRAGDTMTGPLILSADPSANLGSSTKQYVDASIATAGGAFVRRDGTVAMTGALSMGTNAITNVANPTSPQDVATKAYVDAGTLNISAESITSGTLATARLGTIPASSLGGLPGSQITTGTLNTAQLGVVPATSVGDLPASKLTSGTLDLARIGVIGPAQGGTQWSNVARGLNYTGGSVGINVGTPAALLDINGAIRLAMDSDSCSAGKAGSLRYNGGVLEYCDGVGPAWLALGVSGSGLQSLNGLTGNNQAFTLGTLGTAPAFNSAGTLHTLNIPMAAASGVTGGLISKSEYDAFNDKLANTLNQGQMWIGNGSNLATAVTMSGEGTISSSGNFVLGTVDAGKIGSGSFAVARIPHIPASYISSGTLNTAQIGVLSGSSITNISAAAITSGTLELARIGVIGNAQINDLAAGKITSGTLDLARIGSLPASILGSGTINTAQLGTVDGASITNVSAASVTSGTFATARLGVVPATNVGNLPASQITSGTLDTARLGVVPATSIGNLSASQITSGTLELARIGVVGDTQINNLAAGKITSGTLDLARIGVIGNTQISDLAASKITSGTLDTARLGVVPATSIGNLAASQITSGTLDLARIGVIGAAQGGSQWSNVAMGLNYTGGSVGINSATPTALLDINGAIRLAMDSDSCSAGKAGSLRYNGGVLEYCNGVGPAWLALGVSGSGLQSLNGLTGNNQAFTLGTLGTVPAFSSAGTLHTLNIPMAAASGVTGGLITKAEYDSFNNKLGTTLNSGQMWIGNGSNLATAVTMSGEGTISSSGNFVLGTVDAGKIGSGSFDVARIPHIPASYITSGTINTAQLGVIDGSSITSISAGSITSGTLDLARVGVIGDSQINSLSAGKITSGTLDLARVGVIGNAQINDLAASKITSGTLDLARLGTLPASILGSGTINTAQLGVIDGSSITSISAGSITSGTLDLARVGVIGDSQINSLAAGKITSGTLDLARVGVIGNAQINDLAASKITSGTLDLARLGTLPASILGSGTINTAQLGVIDGSSITAISAGSITSGTLDLARIGVIGNAQIIDLAAAKITSGTLDLARIGVIGDSQINGLAAGKVTSGTLDLARVGVIGNAQINDLAAGKITSGTLDLARLGTLPASILGSGTINTAQLGVIDGSSITAISAGSITSGTLDLARVGVIGNAQINDLAASKITSGTLNLAQVGNLPASQVVSGTFAIARIPALSASQISYGTFNISDGTAGTPAYSFAGDADTGLYHPGANTLSISTGGAERITVGSGVVGIGASAPRATLDVNGAIVSRAAQTISTSWPASIDFSISNLVTSSVTCQTGINLHNMKDGGTYSIAVTSTAVGTCSFNAFSGAGTGGLTVRMPPGHGATISGRMTLYSFMVMGTDVWVSWVPGY